ncbi:MAG: putative uncharacterized transposon-derived protein F54H12.3-like [Ignavibacteria bacterium]|nr:MAG: putative uncharacterized transposon-derived protein F54H12.3-like [Ignavibacteria bacterium]
MKPADVRANDEDRIWLRLYGVRGGDRKSQIKTGEKVRISKVKGIFEKGYLPNWSEEHFHVQKDRKPRKRRVYKLKDDLGEDIKGEFYKEELQPITENRYLVEKILQKRKGVNNKEEYFVKWKGWAPKFNSWITEDDFEEIRK